MAQFVLALRNLVDAGFDVGEAYAALNGLTLMVLGLTAGEVNPPAPDGPPPESAEAEAAFRALAAPLLGGEAAFAARHESIFDLILDAFLSGLAIRLATHAASD
jgi:hypothetical protein